MVWRGYILGLAIVLGVASATLLGAHLYKVHTTNIAVIRISGVVEDSRYAYLAEEALRNPNIKAVVVVVDSVGGFVQPCFRTETAFKLLKRAKPVVVSMQDYAASGAYLISTASDNIFAYPDTQTAGIGVIAIWVCYERKWEEEGIDYYVWKSGKMKDIGAPWRPPTEEDNLYMQALVDNLMEELVGRIVLNRPKIAGMIDELRDGFTRDGTKALEMGLVDELGDYDKALSKAEKLAGLKKGEYTIIEL